MRMSCWDNRLNFRGNGGRKEDRLTKNCRPHIAVSHVSVSSTIIQRNHPQPGVKLSYIQQSGDTLYNSDGGDQYTGLDRFGRVIDQYWLNSSTSTATDRFQYGYDRDSNRLYRSNLVNHAFDELYHANGASNGDDNLHLLT